MMKLFSSIRKRKNNVNVIIEDNYSFDKNKVFKAINKINQVYNICFLIIIN